MNESVFAKQKNSINSFNFSCIGSSKRLWIQYELLLEMSGRVFSGVMHF